jgi:hypothetical protein
MEKSVKAALEDSVKKFLGDVSNQFSSWLQEEKGVEISPEELCLFFEVTYKPPSTPGLPSGSSIQTQMPNLPNYYAGTGVSPAKKKGGGRTKKVIDPSLPNCEYIYTRGKTPGKKCQNQVANDETNGSDRFCKQCLKKVAVKSKLEASSSKPTVQAPVLPGNTVKVEEENKVKNGELQVIEIEEHPGKYKEINHGFIVEQGENGTITAHKIEENGVWRDLKEDEKNIALKLGMQVLHSDSAVNVPMPAAEAPPSVPSMLAMPQPPSIPQIQQLGV